MRSIETEGEGAAGASLDGVVLARWFPDSALRFRDDNV